MSWVGSAPLCADERPKSAKSRHWRAAAVWHLAWAGLLKRIFDIDLVRCSNCGGEPKIFAVILNAPVIERIFRDVGGVTNENLRNNSPPDES